VRRGQVGLQAIREADEMANAMPIDAAG